MEIAVFDRGVMCRSPLSILFFAKTDKLGGCITLALKPAMN